MKKILLCGATHGSNFGDSLFALMFKHHIESEFPDAKVVFTRASDYAVKELGLKPSNFRDLFTCDALVYISGGYFGESHNETLKGSLFRWLNYYSFGLLMAARKKEIAIIGVGAGPLNRKYLKKTATYLFNKAKTISVRDETSKNYMVEYGVKNNIVVTTDSAQDIKILNKLIEKSNKKKNYDNLKTKKKVLVHVTSANGQEEFIDKVVESVNKILGSNDDFGFIITSDSVIDESYIKKVYEVLPEKNTIIYEFENPVDFLKLIADVDIIITPKLHVGILGSTYSKSVLSFPIHPGKTTRYYEQIEYLHHCKSLFEVNRDEVETMIDKYHNEKITLSTQIAKSAEDNFSMLTKFIKEI